MNDKDQELKIQSLIDLIESQHKCDSLKYFKLPNPIELLRGTELKLKHYDDKKLCYYNKESDKFGCGKIKYKCKIIGLRKAWGLVYVLCLSKKAFEINGVLDSAIALGTVDDSLLNKLFNTVFS